jgi:hypothetical protein
LWFAKDSRLAVSPNEAELETRVLRISNVYLDIILSGIYLTYSYKPHVDKYITHHATHILNQKASHFKTC